MKKVIWLILISVPFFVSAASGIFQTYAILNINNGGNAYYAGGLNADGGTSFQGQNFGTPTSLILNGGEVKTFENGGSDINGATIFYRVYKQGSTPGNFSNYNLTDFEDLGGGDEKRFAITAGIDLLSIASATNEGDGVYVLEVFWEAFINGGGSHFDSDFGNNFQAIFTLSSMPVTWQSLTLTPQPKGHVLNFSTATESNNHYFEIQRSTDAKNWHKLGTIQGAGTTDRAQDYTFLDQAPVYGHNSYRIKQVDYDGSYSYSSLVSAFWNGKDEPVRIFPNPAKARVFIQGVSTNSTLQLLDLQGRVVRTQVWSPAGLPLDGLTSGLYQVRVIEHGVVRGTDRLLIE